MLGRLTRVVVRRRWWVIAICAVMAITAALLGPGLFGRLGHAVFYDPAAESTRAAALARDVFGMADPDVVALYRLPDGVANGSGVTDPALRQALDRMLARVARDPAVAKVMGEQTFGNNHFVSRDRRSTFVVLSLNGDARAQMSALPRLRRLLTLELPSTPGAPATVRPLLGGRVASGRALTRLAGQSLARGERVALPATGLLLLLIFGSVVAALLPLLLGGLSIALALGILSLLSHLLDVDAFAINVVTILGLGVTIDYALFLVTRYREEVTRGGEPDPQERRRQALVRTINTVGHSVLFSGVTVATSLAGLLFFPQPFLRSVGLGGIAVVLMAVLLALALLPATLTLLGNNLERGRLPWRRGTRKRRARATFWRRLAQAVIRWRVLVCLSATTLLLLLATPFLRLRPSRSDVRALPAASEPRRVSELLARDFPAATLMPSTLLITMDDDVADEDQLGALWDYTARVQKLPSVERVESVIQLAGAHDRAAAERLAPLLYSASRAPDSPAGRALGAIVRGRQTQVRVISRVAPDSDAGQKLVAELRALPPPGHARVLVYGQAASVHDFASGIEARVPYMLLFVAVAMFVVLFAAFRSVILPLKAMLMTALSLTASFGAIVFIFQDGRLRSLLRFQALGTVDAALPVVMFAVVFGLSMDYEVLILGRIREAWTSGEASSAAIVEGVAQTGGVITGAAALMIVVFSAFGAAPVVFVKALGLGMALAVGIDATVVRMLLVPATMGMLGRLNWWAPRWARSSRID